MDTVVNRNRDWECFVSMMVCYVLQNLFFMSVFIMVVWTNAIHLSNLPMPSIYSIYMYISMYGQYIDNAVAVVVVVVFILVRWHYSHWPKHVCRQIFYWIFFLLFCCFTSIYLLIYPNVFKYTQLYTYMYKYHCISYMYGCA